MKDAAPPDYTSGYAERLVDQASKFSDSKTPGSTDRKTEPDNVPAMTPSEPIPHRQPHNLAAPPTFSASAAPPPDYAKSTGPPSNRPAASKPKPTTDSIGQPASRLSSLMQAPPPEEPRERSLRARIKRFTSGESFGEREEEEWRQTGRKGEERGTRAELNYFGVGLAQFGGPFSKKK